MSPSGAALMRLRYLPLGHSTTPTRASRRQNVPCVFMESKLALGRERGVSRAVIAASVTSNEASELSASIRELKVQIERLMV